LSTDCSIDLDVGGFVRVGFAPMDEIKLTAELLAEGWSSAELDRKARSGEVQRIRRGAYDCVPAKSLDRRDQHRRLIAATVRQTFVDTAVSHMSAAVLHQLPIWNNELGRVHITRNQSGGGKVRRYVHLHVAPLTDIDVCEIEGQRVTTLARTGSICCGRCQWSGQCPSAIQHSDRV
jgi:predicted transcriptional regulator of viral defense system